MVVQETVDRSPGSGWTPVPLLLLCWHISVDGRTISEACCILGAYCVVQLNMPINSKPFKASEANSRMQYEVYGLFLDRVCT